MKILARACLLAVLLQAGVALAATPVPSPNASAIHSLNKQMRLLLKDVGHKNEQSEVTLEPDASGLKTIVRVRVHPSNAGAYREDLTKQTNEYIQIHKGDCRTNSKAVSAHTYALNPIVNGTSQTTVNVPIST